MRQQVSDDPKIRTTSEARQGSPRKLNLRVLVTSMLLAIVVAAVLYAFFFSGEF
jgi:hypothetical protein